MGARLRIPQRKFPNSFQCLPAMAPLETQVQSRPPHCFSSSCKILFPLGQMTAMCPLIPHTSYLQVMSRRNSYAALCLPGRILLFVVILKHERHPWLLGCDTASWLLGGPFMQVAGLPVWLTQHEQSWSLSRGSPALEGAVNVLIERQMEERGK